MKRIVFLIIGTLLVLGLVLPGCTTPTPTPTDQREVITIGVAGPMGMAQGKHHMYGAEMARDELNGTNFTTDGITIGGTLHKIELVSIDTNEVLDPTGADGVTEMTKKIGSVDFVVGGFRTEAVLAYRGIVMDAKKIFIDCGAATEELQHSVVDNYAKYQYWFKGTPPNELLLSQSSSKMMSMILMMTRTALNNTAWLPKVAIVAENAAWTTLSWKLAQLIYGSKGMLCGGTGAGGPAVWLVNTVAQVGEVDTVLDQIAAASPKANVIYTIMSGPVGVTYANRVGAKLPGVLTMGINVEAQRQGFPGVAQYAENMIFQDAFPPKMQITQKTVAFEDAFVAKTGEVPIYTAGTYDAIKSLCAVMASIGSTSTSAIIPAMETWVYTNTLATSTVYPKWDGTTQGVHPLAAYGIPGYPQMTAALNKDQVLALYPWLSQAKFSTNGVNVTDWAYNPNDWTMPSQTTHDLVYGMKDANGGVWTVSSFSQWQMVNGKLTKVGIWPKAWFTGLPTNMKDFLAILPGLPASTLTAIGSAGLGLWDKYGYFNWEYPGTGTISLNAWWAWLKTTGQG